MGMSQMCAGADHYFRSSKPHSRKLWDVSEIMKLLVFINIQALLPFFKEPAENILESY